MTDETNDHTEEESSPTSHRQRSEPPAPTPETPRPDDPLVAVDPRFSLANERTFLAWSRTSLAVMAAGLFALRLIPVRPKWIGIAAGGALIVLGALMGLLAYAHWRKSNRSLSRGGELPPSRLPLLVVVAVLVAAVGASAIAVTSLIDDNERPARGRRAREAPTLNSLHYYER